MDPFGSVLCDFKMSFLWCFSCDYYELYSKYLLLCLQAARAVLYLHSQVFILSCLLSSLFSSLFSCHFLLSFPHFQSFRLSFFTSSLCILSQSLYHLFLAPLPSCNLIFYSLISCHSPSITCRCSYILSKVRGANKVAQRGSTHSLCVCVCVCVCVCSSTAYQDSSRILGTLVYFHYLSTLHSWRTNEIKLVTTHTQAYRHSLLSRDYT